MYGDIYDYNDYELLYLARDNHEEVFDIIFWKYSFLIASRIKKLNIPYSLQSDFTQEGYVIIAYAVRNYNEYSKMSFTNYLDMILTRRFITLLRKEHIRNFVYDEELIDEMLDYNNYENVILDLEEKIGNLNVSKCGFSKLEQDIYESLFIKKESVASISTRLDLSPKSIYNTRQRIVKKIQQKLNK